MLPTSLRTAFAVSTFVSMASYATAQTTMASPTPVPGLRTLQYSGCFSSSYPLQDMGSYTFQSHGACQSECGAQGKPVMGLTSGTDCFCGNQLPPADTKVDDGDCSTSCAGYPPDKCGGANRWSIFLTGTTLNQINNAPDPSSGGSSASSASGTAASIVTAPGQTVVMTVPAGSATSSPTPTAAAPSKGPNKAGIAAGVVVGVVVLAAIIAGVFLFLRRRERQMAEKDYQRHNSVSAFVETGKPPGTSHSTGGDSRLDPRVFDRRHSDGSIADNEDYSRRILKVTNPDRS